MPIAIKIKLISQVEEKTEIKLAEPNDLAILSTI